MRKARVCWSNEERAVLVEQVTALRLQFPGDSLVALVRRAQNKFPEERRRRIDDYAHIEWLAADVKERLRFIQINIEDIPSQPAPATVPAAVPPAPVPGPASAGALNKLLDQMTPEEFLVAFARKMLGRVDEAESRLRAKMDRLENMLGAALNKPTVSAATVDTRPRITIVGLLASQAQEVEARCSNVKVRLQFIDKDVSAGDRVNKMPQSDWVIVTRFNDHAWSVQAKALVGADRVLMEFGGITSIVKQVFDIGSRQTKALTGG